ncbi:FtsX-like permease family protein [Alteromonadaceae bacterium M269]|nr:FtsX-like permease family protein [Alteromonadaceae bacterium M269]
MSQFIYLHKQAWASLKKKIGFVATVVVTMGTTLGALLCVLTLGHLLLVEPLPYPEQNKLYRVGHILDDNKGEISADAFTYPGLIHLYKNQEVFEQASLTSYSQSVLTSLPNQPRLLIGYTTPEWFSLLGVKMALGRPFEATEALDTFNPVAILSYDTWVKEFSQSPDILQQKVTFEGVSFSVVGVLSKDFIEPQLGTTGSDMHAWLPWDFNQQTRFKDSWGNIHGALTYIGKIKSGVSATQAEQVLSPLLNDTWQEKVVGSDFFKGWTISSEVRSLKSIILGDSERMLFFMIAGVLGLLIIASANIANLFMSRTAEQQRQLAIYAALGAKKRHLFRNLFAESTVLMAISILVALIISSAGFYLMQTQFASVLPRVNELTLNLFTFGSAFLFAGLFALTFAYLSTKMINYKALSSMLQSSGKGTGVQVSKRFRQVLIVTQVAIATVLIFANISLFKNAVKIIQEPMGFEVDNMVSVVFSTSTSPAPTAEESAIAMAQLKSELQQLPQVKSVSQATSPLNNFQLNAITDPVTNLSFTPDYKQVDAQYFTQIGQPLMEGRLMSAADIKDQNRVAIINDVFAKNLREDGNVIGIELDSSGDIYTVIGVVKGVKLPGHSDIRSRMYFPSPQSHRQMNLTLEPNQSVTREQVVAAIKEVSNAYALFNLSMLPQTRNNILFPQFAAAVSTAALAAITLFLGGVGLYGILSYSTQMRRFEIGTRMAIGAKRKHLINLIVRDNTVVILIGIIMSIIVMTVIYLFNQELLAEYIDVGLIPVFVFTLLAIGSLALFACYWPLRQYINHPAIHMLRGSD